MSPAVSISLFWLYSGTAVARAIRVATDGPWGHCGVIFRLADGTEVYYEALFGEGFRGPTAIAKLHAYVLQDRRRRLAVVPISMDVVGPAAAEAKRRQADEMVKTAGYGEWQLVGMLFFERYGLPVFHSPGRVVCSEAISRLAAPELDLRDARRSDHDKVNPNSAWRRLMEILAGYGHINAPALNAA